MDENKIAIIMCVSDDLYLEESLYYLNKLKEPEGFTVEFFDIHDAKSICEGYNLGMNASDAKYKLYIHQDVFVTDENTLIKCIDFFKSHPKTGLIGVLGQNYAPQDRLFHFGWNVGSTYLSSGRETKCHNFPSNGGEVFAVDGLFMMTQFDLPWREDILLGWDMYDYSQSLEFRKAGYEVRIPPMDNPWTFHDVGRLDLLMYDANILILLNTYPEFFDVDKILAAKPLFSSGRRIMWDMTMEIKERLRLMLEAGMFEAIEDTLNELGSEQNFDTELVYIKDIVASDNKELFFKNATNYSDILNNYRVYRFEQIRKEFD